MVHDFLNAESTAHGVGQVCFFDDLDPERPVLSIGFCDEGDWEFPSTLVGDLAAQACAGRYRMEFRGRASSDDRSSHIAIIFPTGADIVGHSSAAQSLCPRADIRFLAFVGTSAFPEACGYDGCLKSVDWKAALALVRLLVPAEGPIGFDRRDAVRFLTGRTSVCATWRLGEAPSKRAAGSSAVWLRFSARLPLKEIDKTISQMQRALPSATEIWFQAGMELTSTVHCDAIFSGGEKCGSAWKKDPVSGVIGVEKGPLIPVV